jgi:insulysin
MRKLLLLVFLALFSVASHADLSQLPAKASTDRSEYRHLVLDNGLRVILLSDPDLNKSSAAMVIGVGSLMDPKDRPGLAHFLEHMLFLGTEKFPDEADYGNYLQSHGGYSNAYTSGDHTNYHFEINNQAFDGALDRFSQFFIAPLFDPKFTDREMNAVDSEFEKNLENDDWREQEMFRTMVSAGHPEHHFSIGNLDTLKGVKRSEFLAFYDRYYSADQMALAMASTASLDQMETWARQYFSGIRNNNRPDLDYSTALIDPARAPGVVMVEPIKDRRVLDINFPTPGTRALYRSKPDELIGFLLGYEGEGSLLSRLKQQGLATGLSGGAYQATKDYSLFSVHIELTPAGVEKWQDVLQETFAYIETLRESPYPEYLFKERATAARLEELYADKGEGADRAVELARDAWYYPLNDAERARYLWQDPAPGPYFGLLAALRPDNMIALLEFKGAPTDQKEPRFGVKYSVQPLAPALLATLQKPGKLEGAGLPPPNPFIPTSVKLLPPQPVKLIDEPGLTLYYGQDMTFERPQVAYQIRIRQPQAMGELRQAVLRDFYVSVMNEMLNEELYTASVAGLDAKLIDSPKGIGISVSGYDQSADTLLQSMLSRMTAPDLPVERFAALKERKLREWANARLADAYVQDFQFENAYLVQHYYRPEDRLQAAQDIDLDAVKRFAGELFSQGNVEMVAYGNLTQQDATAVARQVEKQLGLKPVPADKVYDTRILDLQPGKPLVAAEVLAVNNSVYSQGFLLGQSTPKNRALAMMLKNYLQEPYYSAMRTRQQLGYIVWSFPREQEKNLYTQFLIQSADYPADELMRRSETFLATLPGQFDAVPDEQIEVLRAGVKAQLEEKDKSIAERAGRYFRIAFERDADWNWTDETMAALATLTRADLRAALQALGSKETPQFTTLLMARQHAAALDSVSRSFTDLAAWKRQQSYQ